MAKKQIVNTTAPPDAVSENVVLHIVRKRTPARDTVLEALEQEAEKKGISMGSLCLLYLSSNPDIRKRIGSK